MKSDIPFGVWKPFPQFGDNSIAVILTCQFVVAFSSKYFLELVYFPWEGIEKDNFEKHRFVEERRSCTIHLSALFIRNFHNSVDQVLRSDGHAAVTDFYISWLEMGMAIVHTQREICSTRNEANSLRNNTFTFKFTRCTQ